MLRNTPKFTRYKFHYGVHFPWAVLALERDNYHCQHCDSDTLDIVVHHLDKSRRNGLDKMNNSLDNLLTLCRRCHARIHGFDNIGEKHQKVKELREQGLSFAEVGKALNITRQRAHQLYQVMIHA